MQVDVPEVEDVAERQRPYYLLNTKFLEKEAKNIKKLYGDLIFDIEIKAIYFDKSDGQWDVHAEVIRNNNGIGMQWFHEELIVEIKKDICVEYRVWYFVDIE